MKTNANKKIMALAILCTFLVAMFFPLVQSQLEKPQTTATRDNLHWWNTQWPYRKLITIDHTKVSADLTHFPVLLTRPSDPDLTAAQPNGQDIVFIRYDDNTSIQPHELESFNHINGKIIAWVNVATVSSTTDTKLWMYYGNPNCPSQENIPATWDTSYVMVQHLNETGTTMYDSTSYHNNGISTGTTYTDAGKIDGGQLYNGNDKIVVNNFTYTPNALTFETWAYRDNTTFIYIACKGTYSSTNDWLLYLRDNQLADQGIDFSVQNHTSLLRKGDTPLGNWFYLTATYENGNAALYYNGTLLGTAVGWPPITNAYPHLGLGNDYMGTEGGLYPMTDVRLDEVRVSNVARSSGWIATNYANQNNPTSFASFAAEQQYEYSLTTTCVPPAGGTITALPAPPYYYNDIVTLTATPNQGYTFDHWSGDLTGNQNPKTLLIDANKAVTATFILGNTPPVAKDDAATVQENSTNNQINVLANDSDPDGDTLSIISVTQPDFGTSTHDGSYAYYTPNKAYTGKDSFTYTISDGNGGTATATVSLTVLPTNENNTPPYQPNHPIPDNGETNVSITTDIWWTGGDPDIGDSVTYDVYFGTTLTPLKVASNQSTNTYNLPILANGTTYHWRIVSWDNHKATTPGPLWSFTTQTGGNQETSINVTITRPLENSFYLRNFRLLRRLPGNTIIYGPITIKASVTVTNTSIDHVEFYIDSKLKKSDDSAPYTYRWAPLRSFKHNIAVKAYDTKGNVAIDQITVFKWRLHPIILLGGAYIISDLMK
jgi:hypothetical protein